MKVTRRHIMDAGRCMECRTSDSNEVLEVDMQMQITRLCPVCAANLVALIYDIQIDPEVHTACFPSDPVRGGGVS